MSQTPTPAWSENDSQKFIDLGRYFVPNRELQIATICDLIPERDEPFNVLELSCGEGLLAEAVLQRFSTSTVYGYDLSPAMLQRAQQRLAAYGERFRTQQFALADHAWRSPAWPVHAIISSLTIHHLDDAGKETLYSDVFRMLAPGGVFVVADLVQPANLLAQRVAEREWDRAVEERAVKLDGNTDALALFEQEKWNLYRYPDPVDMPSRLFDQLRWLEAAGFRDVDVYWMRAGHAIFGGTKRV
jgi:tRNA (cmo5U34)-methyltransferase